ncbi:MAG TPA: PilZ domain-containing protein [Pyrinomonadaceae bacterium]|nr:PilZ domain-containing protein [Pyrinomonadaceae bacterium]
MDTTHPPWRRKDNAEQPRRATRHEAQLDARLLFQLTAHTSNNPDAGNATHATRPLRLVGRTRNISETGLAFVVPSLRIGEEFAGVLGCPLLITLYLPSGSVEIQATPVRYEPLPPTSSERGYLIGVQITEMSDHEWVRMVEYVRTLR